MKITKRFILTLAAILSMTGAWAQDAEEVTVTKTANNNEWTLTMPASDVELQVEYYMPFDLTLADGSNAHGTVAFTVGDAAATQALKDDVVTVSVTPADGYTVKGVTAQTSSQEAVSMSNGENGWTFTMPEDNVTVTVTYTKNLQDAWIQAIADQTYTGNAITPTVTVQDGEATLVLTTDYTVAYSNNVETGTATVTVTGTGNYSGTATANFTIVADKTALNTAITEAETYYESIKDSNPTAAAALKTAIDDAKEKQGNADASQDDVNNALSVLTTAKTTAEQTVLTETKTALNDAIAEAEAYYNSIKDSNPAAAATLLEAITAVKAVKDNADATQEQVDAAIADLAGAKTTTEDTVLTETKTALNDAITEAETYYNSIKDSNPEAAATLLEAINAAKAVKEKSDATQAEVDDAIAALTGAADAAYEAQGLKRITLTEQYGTYCLDKDLDFSETTGLTAYIAAGYNKTEGSLLMVKVTSVPAGTGLLLKSTSATGGDFTAKMITSSPYIYSNLLTGTTAETTVSASDFILGEKNDKVAFYPAEDGTLAAGKAYLKGLAASSARMAISLVFDDEATAISDHIREAVSDGDWYTLDGRKLEGKPTRKGLYVKNGKKIVVR